MIPHWTQQVARSLSAKRPSATLESHLDALLLWLGNPANPRAADLDTAIRQAKLSRRQASARAYELLDHLLFDTPQPPSSRTLGLPPDTDPTLAKQRYRRLIQAYHPDRHQTRIAWATHHTEQINLAFDAYRRGASEKTRRPDARAKSKPRAAKGSAWWLPWIWPRQLPSVIGRVRNRLIAGLAVICLLIVGVSMFFDEQPAPRPKIIRPSAPEAARPAPPAGPETVVAPPADTMPPITDARQEHRPKEPRALPETETLETPSLDRSKRVGAEPSLASDAPTQTATTREPRNTVESPRQTPADPGPPTETGSRDPSAVTDTPIQTETNSPVVTSLDPPNQAPPSSPRPLAEKIAETPAPTESLATPGTAHPTPDQASVRAQGATSPNQLERIPQQTPEHVTPRLPRLAIPSATPPSQPQSPTPPDQPNRSITTAVTAPFAPADTASGDCRSVPDMLTLFQRAYDAGALDRLMALYSPAARENTLDTWFSIRQTYAEWFGKTSARRIRFDRLQVKPTANTQRCAAIAIFQVSYLDTQGRAVDQTGVIEMLFERKGPELRILRVRY